MVEGPWIAPRDGEMVARGSNQVIRRLKLPSPPTDPLGEREAGLAGVKAGGPGSWLET